MATHEMAGRVAAFQPGNIVTFCRCGLGFFGHDVGQADGRWQEHFDEVYAELQAENNAAADPF